MTDDAEQLMDEYYELTKLRYDPQSMSDAEWNESTRRLEELEQQLRDAGVQP